ncbi:ClpP family protease [Anatilimnocola floriformis]|uniref:ClpP family protease n=1 Tax=Anatilimnocola floriformis TaxID=2948575 RepID=UPI0020C24D30|nr:ATP-dependent Clp protease proteolytic subunit [Anatilimnocola floriformis]
MTEPDSPGDDLPEGPLEIAICGDLTEREAEITEKLFDVPPGGDCVIYFNSPGGAAYSAYSLASLIKLRGLNATGIVVGECSSAAIWIFAACRRRLVTPHSVLLFHPMKWQSEEHVIIAEAAEWARHFVHLEKDMDELLARLFGVPLETLKPWLNPGSYVTGSQLVTAGLAEAIGLEPLPELMPPPPPKPTAKSRK